MKKWIKYLISIVVFSIMYIVVKYLLTKDINWKMVIVATIIYAIIYTIFDSICNQSTNE